jgi:hypothetical protein
MAVESEGHELGEVRLARAGEAVEEESVCVLAAVGPSLHGLEPCTHLVRVRVSVRARARVRLSVRVRIRVRGRP